MTKRIWAGGLLATPLLLIAFTVLIRPASATVALLVPVESLAQRSDLIVRGQVAEVVPFEGDLNGTTGIYTRVRLHVTEWWWGPGGAEVELWVHGGRVGRRIHRWIGQATFEEGEDVVVFLEKAGTVNVPTELAQGVYRVVAGTGPDASSSTSEMAVSAASPSNLFTRDTDGALVPVDPGLLRPRSLPELRQRVRAALGSR